MKELQLCSTYEGASLNLSSYRALEFEIFITEDSSHPPKFLATSTYEDGSNKIMENLDYKLCRHAVPNDELTLSALNGLSQEYESVVA